MRLVLDSIFTKYILANSTYSLNANSPHVLAYHHISNMIERAMRNKSETIIEVLKQENQKLKRKEVEATNKQKSAEMISLVPEDKLDGKDASSKGWGIFS